MADAYQYSSDTVASPGTRAVAITPHNTNALTDIPKALYVGVGGDITMRGLNGAADVLWKNVQSGQIIPFRAQFIRSTGTTATNIVAIY